MRSRELHDALRSFALDAAALLSDDQAAGAELEFDLGETSARRGPTLYHYRPLTAKFIADRWPRLRCLPTCAPAAETLGAGAAAYLRVNGLRGAEAEPALQAMLERLYEDITDFAFPEERFERVYAEVERTLFERSQRATVLVAVHGLELSAERVELGDGMALERGDRTDAPDEAVWGNPLAGAPDGPQGEPNALLTLTRDVTPDDALPVEEARARFRRLLTGLRLWKPGGVALASVAWRRTGDGVWQPLEIEPTGVARGEPWILVEGEEVELREFLGVVERSALGGGVSWALSRFEHGLGRRLDAEALSDYLLALRALLDTGVDGGRSSLGLRVAVLCSEEEDRRRTQRRVDLALALERFVMGNGAEEDYFDVIGTETPRTLVDEVERHLRALLRDLVCGYLDADLRSLADELLLDRPEPDEVRAASMREEPATVAARGAGEPPAEEPVAEPEPAGLDYGSEIEALEDEPDDFAVHGPEIQQSAFDWDDPDGYSAPV